MANQHLDETTGEPLDQTQAESISSTPVGFASDVFELLQQGIKTWNQWRKEYPYVQLDLSRTDFFNDLLFETGLGGPNLSGANFSRVNLFRAIFIRTIIIKAIFSGANLSESDLREANLSEATLMATNLSLANLSKAKACRANFLNANLAGANLAGANLAGAGFVRADLAEANLAEANLAEANLTNANLYRADLSRANLTGADFSNAVVNLTIFGDTDLSVAKGLEAVKSVGPSTIGIDTIIRSHGNIPEVFLRGAGVPDLWITYARSLINNPIDYYTCFISCSSRDEAFARRLYADLQNNGVRCWFAPENLKIGDHYHQRIDESIRLYDKLILILSEHAVQSVWVEREVVSAREKEDREQQPILFPIRLDDAVMHTTKAWAADVRRRGHIGDFTQWKDHDTYQVAFERLLRDLKAERKSQG